MKTITFKNGVACDIERVPSGLTLKFTIPEVYVQKASADLQVWLNTMKFIPMLQNFVKTVRNVEVAAQDVFKKGN
jgi:hypothetical protein